MEGFNTHLLFPLACGIASGILCYCFTDRKKFGIVLSLAVGALIGGIILYILPSFTTWTGSL